jgi:EmrB/QacA subfamily drug resistance transporter
MTVIKDSKGQLMLMISIVIIVTMDGLDASIVNVALPTISESFVVDTSTVAWVSVTYFMMLAGLLLVFSRLADRGIIKRTLIVGLVVFSFFSLTCGLSSSFEMLLLSRIFQGIGAAAMGACAPLLCVRYLPSNKLGVGMSVVTVGGSIGYALGPALGGILIQYLSWNWIFFINIPIGIVGVLFTAWAIPKDKGYVRSHFDVAGAALMLIAVASGVFALERFTHVGLGSAQIISSAVVCITSSTIFIIWERRCKNPMLNLGLFRSWRFDSVLMAFLLINLSAMGIAYLIPFYLSLGMGFDSAVSGMFLFIPPFISLIICVPIGRWSDHTGRRWFSVFAGVALTISGGIYFFIDPEMGIVPLVVSLFFTGMVWGVCGGPTASRIVETVSEEEKGTGSALIAVSSYLGGTVGIALFAAFFSIIANSGNTPFADMQLSTFMTGFHPAMLLGVILAIITVVLSAVVRDKDDDLSVIDTDG